MEIGIIWDCEGARPSKVVHRRACAGAMVVVEKAAVPGTWHLGFPGNVRNGMGGAHLCDAPWMLSER